MMIEFYIPSTGIGQIHCCKWAPQGEIRAIVQIVHGIAEHAQRYDDFASYLNTLGILVVAEDHMGHGKSVNHGGIRGYFHGGWFAAAADTHSLTEKTMGEYPGVPYVIFGHSMGSFLTRTVLCKYPQTRLTAAVICGTGWQPRGILPAAKALCDAVCRSVGETNPSQKLDGLVFGAYNRRVDAPKTKHDWLSRDDAQVRAYAEDPLCGFTASCGLLRDMMVGLGYIENPRNLAQMKKSLPVFFICGGDDPVGSYSKGVLQAARAFTKAGMQDVSIKVYPEARHELLNEVNRQEVYSDVAAWLKTHVF